MKLQSEFAAQPMKAEESYTMSNLAKSEGMIEYQKERKSNVAISLLRKTWPKSKCKPDVSGFVAKEGEGPDRVKTILNYSILAAEASWGALVKRSETGNSRPSLRLSMTSSTSSNSIPPHPRLISLR